MTSVRRFLQGQRAAEAYLERQRLNGRAPIGLRIVLPLNEPGPELNKSARELNVPRERPKTQDLPPRVVRGSRKKRKAKR